MVTMDPTPSPDLAAFLRTQFDADAELCRELADFLAATAVNDLPTHPARVLADIEAKRRIIDLHVDRRECDRCNWFDGELYPCETLRLLAVPYADRAGYDDGWKL